MNETDLLQFGSGFRTNIFLPTVLCVKPFKLTFQLVQKFDCAMVTEDSECEFAVSLIDFIQYETCFLNLSAATVAIVLH